MFNQTTLDENRNKALDLLLKEMDAVTIRQFGSLKHPYVERFGLFKALEHKIDVSEGRSEGDVNPQTK